MAGAQAREALGAKPDRRRTGLVPGDLAVNGLDGLRKRENHGRVGPFWSSHVLRLGIRSSVRPGWSRDRRWRNGIPRRELARSRTGPPLVLDRWALFRTRLLAFEDPRP